MQAAPDNHLRVAIILTDLLENKFSIGGIRFGFEPLVGLIPGIGDLIGLLVSLYLVWIAVMAGLPEEKISKMLGNIVLDFLVGLVPVVGDFGDFAIKANTKNLKILHDHWGRPSDRV